VPTSGNAPEVQIGGEREASWASETMAKDTYVSPAYIALVFQVLGDTDSEFAWYAKAYDDRAEWLLWLTVDPIYDNQRNDPRFQDLVKRVGVAQPTGNKVIGSVSLHLLAPKFLIGLENTVSDVLGGLQLD